MVREIAELSIFVERHEIDNARIQGRVFKL